MSKRNLFAAALSLILTVPAFAVEPVCGGTFNVASPVDLRALMPAKCVDTLLPKARSEGVVL